MYLIFIIFFSVMMSAAEKQQESSVVTLYYFHSKMQCPSCQTMENYTKETLDTYFKKEIESKKIVFRKLQIEKPENREYLKKYKIFGSGIVLEKTKKDKVVKSEKLEKITELYNDRKAFMEYIKNKISEYMKDE